jgi:hypothetical protein
MFSERNLKEKRRNGNHNHCCNPPITQQAESNYLIGVMPNNQKMPRGKPAGGLRWVSLPSTQPTGIWSLYSAALYSELVACFLMCQGAAFPVPSFKFPHAPKWNVSSPQSPVSSIKFRVSSRDSGCRSVRERKSPYADRIQSILPAGNRPVGKIGRDTARFEWCNREYFRRQSGA